jgi:hypothetical protein
MDADHSECHPQQAEPAQWPHCLTFPLHKKWRVTATMNKLHNDRRHLHLCRSSVPPNKLWFRWFGFFSQEAATILPEDQDQL